MSELNETALRTGAARVLRPGPMAGQYCFWSEGGRCYHGNPSRLSDGRAAKVCSGICDVAPKPLTESLPEIAEMLLRKVLELERPRLAEGQMRLYDVLREQHDLEDGDESLAWWLMATPAERIQVCLEALKGETK